MLINYNWSHRNIFFVVCVFTFPIRCRKHGEHRRQAGGRRLFLHQRQVWVTTDLHANHALRRRGWDKTVWCVPVFARLLSSVAVIILRGKNKILTTFFKTVEHKSIIIIYNIAVNGVVALKKELRLFICYLSSSWLL